MLEQLCPWELSKRLVHLGFNSDSFYKWVHPYQGSVWIENKSRYILVDCTSVLDRKSYPAYGIGEILQSLPEEYILGRIEDDWYCKSFSDSWDTVISYESPILACAYAAIFMLEQTEPAEDLSEVKE